MYGFLSEGIGQPSFTFTPYPSRALRTPLQPGVPFIRSVNEVLVRVRIFSGTGFPVPSNAKPVFNELVSRSRYNTAVGQLTFVPSIWGPTDGREFNIVLPSQYIDRFVRILRYGISAQVRSRGGAMTIMGLAGVGYALGGLPGAAIGAAAALLKGRLDETRVG